MVEDGVATYYVWDGLRLLESRNADHTLKARFTHGATQIEGIGSGVEVYVPSSSKRYYMLMDHRGSVAAVLDESKTVVATRLYSAFGEVVSESGTWPDEVPFGYQSNWMYLDGLTLPDGSPLYLSPTRVYHAGAGRFLQRDIWQEAQVLRQGRGGSVEGQWGAGMWDFGELHNHRNPREMLEHRVRLSWENMARMRPMALRLQTDTGASRGGGMRNSPKE
jgi:hypothetical protein